MESEQFEEWFEKVFVKFTQNVDGAKLLILVGHASHFSIKIIEIADTNNIHIICMPAHSTHLLQPLDVGVFKHFKAGGIKTLQNYYFSNNGQSVSKNNIAGLIKQCVDNESPFSRAHAVGGFESSGMFPLNIEKIKPKLSKEYFEI
jgi:hypothetical protein